MANAYDTFAFDLDGTLLDTVPDLIALTNRILSAMDAPERSREEVLSFIGDGVRSYISLALPDGATEEDVERAQELWDEWFLDHYDSSDPYDGMDELLEGLASRGCRTAVISNRDQRGVDLILEHSPIGGFSVALGTGPDVPRKPDPTSILMALESIGADPASTIYIGDTPSDIVAGRDAGCATAAVLWGYHSREDLEAAEPDIIVEHPLELLAYAAYAG